MCARDHGLHKVKNARRPTAPANTNVGQDIGSVLAFYLSGSEKAKEAMLLERKKIAVQFYLCIRPRFLAHMVLP